MLMCVLFHNSAVSWDLITCCPNLESTMWRHDWAGLMSIFVFVSESLNINNQQTNPVT